ncbi:MAG: hypothetical protein DMF06_03370 [Verrucomicrobia bacterium]|nr:MAG: hypothetical protein DMF06_03370 [Verrucomicrobiota bacterium]
MYKRTDSKYRSRNQYRQDKASAKSAGWTDAEIERIREVNAAFAAYFAAKREAVANGTELPQLETYTAKFSVNWSAA